MVTYFYIVVAGDPPLRKICSDQRVVLLIAVAAGRAGADGQGREPLGFFCEYPELLERICMPYG